MSDMQRALESLGRSAKLICDALAALDARLAKLEARPDSVDGYVAPGRYINIDVVKLAELRKDRERLEFFLADAALLGTISRSIGKAGGITWSGRGVVDAAIAAKGKA